MADADRRLLQDYFMSARKRSEPTWSTVKTALVGLDPKGLIGLIGDLYRLTSTNRDFLHARLLVGADDLAPYRKTIETALFPDVLRNKQVDVAAAKRAISQYRAAKSDSTGLVELMVYFVECGNGFVVQYGYTDESMLGAVIQMFSSATKLICKMEPDQASPFKDRLSRQVFAAEGIGYGYYDELLGLYEDRFGS